jgi:hypothetical protein
MWTMENSLKIMDWIDPRDKERARGREIPYRPFGAQDPANNPSKSSWSCGRFGLGLRVGSGRTGLKELHDLWGSLCGWLLRNGVSKAGWALLGIESV